MTGPGRHTCQHANRQGLHAGGNLALAKSVLEVAKRGHNSVCHARERDASDKM
jgi:hypothetical protein